MTLHWILRAPFDRRGLDTELLLTESRVAALPAGHPQPAAEPRRADLAGEPMPRWAGQTDPAALAYWTGADTPGPARTQPDESAPGPEINDISQLLDGGLRLIPAIRQPISPNEFVRARCIVGAISYRAWHP